MTDKKQTEKRGRGRGRPVKNEIELIDDTPQNIARSIFRGADKKIKLQQK